MFITSYGPLLRSKWLFTSWQVKLILAFTCSAFLSEYSGQEAVIHVVSLSWACHCVAPSKQAQCLGPSTDFELFCTSCKNSGNEVLMLIDFWVCAITCEHLQTAAVEAAVLRLDISVGWLPQKVRDPNYSVELRLLNFSYISPRFPNNQSKCDPLPINELEEAWNSSYVVWDSPMNVLESLQSCHVLLIT